MFERYTEKARRTIFFARYEASQFGAPYIETEHLLLGLLREDKGLAARILPSDTTIESIKKQIAAHTPLGEKIPTSVDLPLSTECKRVLAYGAEEAERLKHKYIGTVHLLLGLLREDRSYAAQLLREREVTLEKVRENLGANSEGVESDGILARFSRDLTQAAQAGTLDTNESFDSVVDRVVEVLWRRSKNCPLLLCEQTTATAIVQRLAFRITARQAPEFFYRNRVFSLDLEKIASETDVPTRITWIFNAIVREIARNRNTPCTSAIWKAF